MDKEYQKWLRVDPTPKLPGWLRSDEGKFAVAASIAVGLYLIMFFLSLRAV